MIRRTAMYAGVALLVSSLGLCVLAGPRKSDRSRPAMVNTSGGTLEVLIKAKAFFTRKTWNILKGQDSNEVVVDIRVISAGGKLIAEKVMAYEISQKKRGFEVKLNQGPLQTVNSRAKLSAMLARWASIFKTETLKSDLKRDQKAYVEVKLSLNPVQVYRAKNSKGARAAKPVRTISYDYQVTYRSRRFQL